MVSLRLSFVCMQAKSHPEDLTMQAEKTLYDAQATFYSRASKLLTQENSKQDSSTRTARITMLQMLDQFMSDRQDGEASETVEQIKSLAVETGDLSILPKAAETTVRIGHQDIPLSYAEYFAYNTGIIANYYTYAQDVLASDASAESKVSALKKLYSAAKKTALQQVFQNSASYFHASAEK